MRHLEKCKTAPSFWAGIALPAKLGLGVLILGLAGPALGGREAPGVWVPLAPADEALGASSPPMVLVPWFPEYMAAPVSGLPDGDVLGGAARSGVLPSDIQQAVTGRRNAAPAPARSLTLSDVVRDVNWRRHTAKRLRQQPGVKPIF